MNAKFSTVALALVAASAAFTANASLAQDKEWVEFNNVPATKTRAQVRAELEDAYAKGELQRTEWVEFKNVPSTKTRAQVRAELEDAYAKGELQRTEWVEFKKSTH